jgi:nitrogen regulatory protein PII
MIKNFDLKDYNLIFVISNHGSGSKIIKYAKQHGVSGGTVFFGKGTVKNKILEFLEISETKKEIVLMIADKNTAKTTLDALNTKFSFHKANYGIAFSTPIKCILGARSCKCAFDMSKRSVEDKMYNAIFTIVDKGKAESVIEAAEKAGSKGGTIINARGSGIHETSKVFSMEIEPEKEIVLILSETQLTDAITLSIKENLQIEEPGNGIIFVLDVDETYGIY